jgi:D-glycero-D-manno-heptose 1,7-bisphosphate phosphatase
MFLEIGERFNVDLKGMPVVGDSLRDLQAGVAVGCKPYLVLTGKGAKTQLDPDLPDGTQIYPDLAAVAAELTA